MITIFKGNHKVVCSKQVYENQFKELGYQIASNNKEATDKVASLKKQEEDNQEEKQELENQQLEMKYGFNTSKKLNTKKGKK